MSSIGPDFGISKNTGHQETRATAPTSTTLQALGPATALQVLTAHHSLPDRVPTPPRFELEMLGNFVAFKMEGVKDGLFHTSDYKKAVFKLFFGVEFVSPVKSAALDFANAFMVEAARYGIDGQVFCKAAGTVLPFDTFVTFVFICISHACGPQKEAVHIPARTAHSISKVTDPRRSSLRKPGPSIPMPTWPASQQFSTICRKDCPSVWTNRIHCSWPMRS